MPSVLDPLTLAGLRLPCALIRSATAEYIPLDTPDDAPRLAAIYTALVRGGIGLVVTGHIAVHPTGRIQSQMAAAFSDVHRHNWAHIAAQVHHAGGLLVGQINHCGGRCTPQAVGTPVCVSLVPDRTRDPMHGDELTPAMIAELIAAFAASARTLKECGMDGIQLHAAHGYLGSQFLSPLTNKRNDDWGGRLANRARFLREVVRATRRALGPGVPLGMKLGAADSEPGGLTIDEAVQAAQWFVADGLDFIEISGAFHQDTIKRRLRAAADEAYFLPFARAMKAALPIPVISVGGFRSLAVMNDAIASGACDAVALCRPLIRQPDLPAVLAAGGACTCVSCNQCFLHRTEGLVCRRDARDT
jgi:2,4-dienoyl-CoA reductase-like NADH-dependent reductase (Old Yellow Enzyme family)